MQETLINDVSFIDGSNRVPIISKIKCWQKNGAKITIMTTASGAKVYQSQLDDVKVLLIPTFNLVQNRIVLILEYLLRNAWALVRFGPTIKSYNLVYSISAVADNLIFPFALKLLGQRFIWSVVMDNKVTFQKERNVHVRFLAFIFFKFSTLFVKRADAVFVVNKELKEFLTGAGISVDKILVTGNAVETDTIRSVERPNKYSYDAVYVGRINEAKGAYDLLNLVLAMKTKYPNFKLAVAGPYDAGVKDQYLHRIAELKLCDNIILRGYVSGSEKFGLIKSSKVFISLSHSESFGVAVLEAVCCGTPTVVYDLPIYRELYTNKEVQMILYKDESAATALVTDVLESPEKYTLSEKTKEGWLNKFSWEVFAQEEWNKINEVRL